MTVEKLQAFIPQIFSVSDSFMFGFVWNSYMCPFFFLSLDVTVEKLQAFIPQILSVSDSFMVGFVWNSYMCVSFF